MPEGTCSALRPHRDTGLRGQDGRVRTELVAVLVTSEPIAWRLIGDSVHVSTKSDLPLKLGRTQGTIFAHPIRLDQFGAYAMLSR